VARDINRDLVAAFARDAGEATLVTKVGIAGARRA
jgi:hypothetical protein